MQALTGDEDDDDQDAALRLSKGQRVEPLMGLPRDGAPRARDLIEATDDHGVDRIGALRVSATIAAETGNATMAERHFQEALRCAAAINISHPEAETRANRADMLLRQGRHDEALDEAHLALTLAESWRVTSCATAAHSAWSARRLHLWVVSST